MRVLGMIERPHRPAIGGMTAVALLAEPAFVHVITRMAVDACRRRPIEGLRGMALRAADEAVQAEQGEIAQVMIERDIGAPSFLAMARFAPTAKLAAVRVFAAMAAGAVLG